MGNRYKSSFPIFDKYPDLAYLDNAATTQKPRSVIDRISSFYATENANVHRGVYTLSNHATDAYDEVRGKVAGFIGTLGPETIGFTKGTTESINIVARSFVDQRLKAGDNIVTTLMEHHANFLPWQQLTAQRRAELRIGSVTTDGDLEADQLISRVDEKTRLVALTHVSNTLGTVNPVTEIVQRAHELGVPVLIDAAQSIASFPMDVADLGCDFLVFSGHKMFGPFGTGVLYVAPQWIDEMQPYNYGGGMIQQVAVSGSSFARFPHNLEAGTPDVAGIVGLGSAVDFVMSLDRQAVQQHITKLTGYARQKLLEIEDITLIGQPAQQSGILSFHLADVHPHDVASALNREQVAVRAGMHCTQPLLQEMGWASTVRISLSIYNSEEEIDRLTDALVSLRAFWHE